MGRWVLLQHTLPDGSWHYDWMLEPGRSAREQTHSEPRLICFRILSRPDQSDVQVFEAQRLTDHRRDYLTYEGPVPNNRGQVRRVAEGTCEILSDGPIFQVTLHEAGLTWTGTRREPSHDLYRFTLSK